MADPTPATDDTVSVRSTEETPVLHAIEVEVEVGRVESAYADAFKTLAKQVNVRGFRRGKAPRSVLQKLYGATVDEQIEQTLIAETLQSAVEQTGLTPVTQPTIDAGRASAGEPFRYTARVEVKPTIELPELDGLPGTKPAVEVGDEEVDKELEALRQRNAPEVEEPDGTVAAEDHILNVDFVGRIGGEIFEGGSGQDVRIQIGTGQFIPGFEEQLVGAAAGDDCEVSVTFPEDYGNQELAGQDAVFAVHVESIKRREAPTLDDEFAKDVGDFETLEELRERLQSDMLAAREREATSALRRSLITELVDRTSFEVPPGLIEGELDRQIHRARHQLAESMPAEAIDGQLARFKEDWREQAEREVREALLLEAITTAEGIEVEAGEVDVRIEEMAASQGVDSPTLRSAYGEESLVAGLTSQIKDEKALEILVSRAKVEETTDS